MAKATTPTSTPRRELHAVEIFMPETVFLFAADKDADDFATTLARYALPCAIYRLDLGRPISKSPTFVYAAGMSAARNEGDTGVYVKPLEVAS